MPYNAKNKYKASDSIRGVYPSPHNNQTPTTNQLALTSFSSNQSAIQVMMRNNHIQGV